MPTFLLYPHTLEAFQQSLQRIRSFQDPVFLASFHALSKKIFKPLVIFLIQAILIQR